MTYFHYITILYNVLIKKIQLRIKLLDVGPKLQTVHKHHAAH